jgi:hypothetical protein
MKDLVIEYNITLREQKLLAEYLLFLRFQQFMKLNKILC